MKSFQDVLYNWLTIKVVCDARPNDTAARDTLAHFDKLLAEEHNVSDIEITTDDLMYYVSCQKGEEPKKLRFPRELIETMLNQINLEPEKYENYRIEE